MNQLAAALNELYKDLNDDFLNDLKAYSKDNYSIGLFELIEKFSITDNDIIEDINELKENNSISSMTDYYELIDYMFENMEG